MLYQINTRVGLKENWGRKATLKDVPDEDLDRQAGMGFEWIYLLSVWQTGEAGLKASRTIPQWVKGFKEQLPDLEEDDICGSGFAITGYELDRSLGELWELLQFKERLNKRGMKLMLDFVPNHTAMDHPWVKDHPEYYISGTERDLESNPHNFTRLEDMPGRPVFAYGRDPYFTGWADTLQLNYGDPGLREAMLAELVKVSAFCDGLRVDMAMLITPEIFRQTWGIDIAPFWPDAIAMVKRIKPGFCFLAEVYWDMEWELQQQGFDYTYDKRLYDRLIDMETRPVKDHLRADMDFQRKLCRFLENHDEKRIASVLEPDIHKAAALITYLSPGLRFFHQGQIQGWKNRLSVHLCRRNMEADDPMISSYYSRLLSILKEEITGAEDWKLMEVFDKAGTNVPDPPIIAFQWRSKKSILVAAINYSPGIAGGRLKIPGFTGEPQILLEDDRSQTVPGSDSNIENDQIGLVLPPWGFRIIKLLQ